MQLAELLNSGRPVVADGAMGTMLLAEGLRTGDSPELWNVLPERAALVRAVHRGYVDAGAQIVLTNSFGGSPVRLRRSGLAERADELNRAAAELACAGAEGRAVVAGSIGPTGELLAPVGDLSYEEAAAAFEAQARALIAGGVGALWIETMSDLEEVRAAVEGARRASATIPIVATMTFGRKGRTMMGVTAQRAVVALRELGVVAAGANCGNGPDEIEAVIAAMRATDAELPLIAKSNAGLPELVDGQPVYRGTPELMAGYAQRARALGATVIGACCGSTPAHIRAMAEALR